MPRLRSLLTQMVEWASARKRNAAVAALVVAATFSVGYYWFDWWKYYDGMRAVTESQQREYASHLAVLYLDTGDAAQSLAAFKLYARRAVPSMKGTVHVVDSTSAPAELIASSAPDNSREADSTRSEVVTRVNLGDMEPALEGIYFTASYRNRPPFPSALWRAATWSASDLANSPSAWLQYRLYMRSLPFWVYGLIIFTLVFLLLRQFGRLLEVRRHAAQLGIERSMSILRSRLEDLEYESSVETDGEEDEHG